MTDNSNNRSLNTYFPALDGLRGIAILWVLLHNGALDAVIGNDSIIAKIVTLTVNMGWLGVQLFFVLSGFLITYILIEAKKNQTKHLFRNFYLRRVLRIFPIYYLFLIFSFVIVVIFSVVPDWLQSAYDLKWWYFFYINNWLLYAHDIGFSHLWSLAVEEQFYLIWPFLVVFTPSRFLPIACTVIILSSVICRLVIHIYLPGIAESAVYILTPARLDSLAIGALLAIMLTDKQKSRFIDGSVAIVFIISLIYMLTTLIIARSFSATEPGWQILNQTFAALLFVTAVYYAQSVETKNTKIKFYIKLLSLPWLRSVGRYSYTMYIIHFPVSRILHSYISEPLLKNLNEINSQLGILVYIFDLVTLFAVTYILAWCSWQIIEKPVLNLKRYFPMKTGK